MKTDAQLQQDVMDQIKWEPCAAPARVGVAAQDGVVTLTGTVASFAEKWAVEKAAQRVHGVKGIAEEITVMPSGSHERSDTEIAAAAVNSLRWHVWVPNEVQVAVTNGWVTLSGHVTWDFQRTAARDAVCYLSGVKGVSNQVVIKAVPAPGAIKVAIEKALVRDAEIDSGKVRVAAEGGNVTLTGTVRSWGERTAAGAAAWNAPGVSNVRNDIAVSLA